MMKNDDEPLENWKQFQGTELGGLMSKLYSNQNKIKINYPKPNTKNTFVPGKEFISMGAKTDAVDPRKSTRRPVNISIPKYSVKSACNDDNSTIYPINAIVRRKTSQKIQAEMNDIKERQQYFRPAYTKPISSEQEKDRLNQIFSHKGGKGLPEELTNPIGEAPYETIERKKEAERIHSVKVMRGLVKPQYKGEKMSEKEEFAQQIVNEIDERRLHLQEMQKLGIKTGNEDKIRAEISKKLLELKSIQEK
jgi:hypothetical protein